MSSAVVGHGFPWFFFPIVGPGGPRPQYVGEFFLGGDFHEFVVDVPTVLVGSACSLVVSSWESNVSWVQCESNVNQMFVPRARWSFGRGNAMCAAILC